MNKSKNKKKIDLQVINTQYMYARKNNKNTGIIKTQKEKKCK